MTIEVKTRNRTISFGSISVGEIFTLDKKYYIKAKQQEPKVDTKHYAVNLANGVIIWVDPKTDVEYLSVDYQIIIYNEDDV